MKNDVTDKSIMRRYLDDMYTQEEARGLLSRLKDDIHAPMLDELATDVWKEAAMEELTPAWNVKNIRKKPVGY